MVIIKLLIAYPDPGPRSPYVTESQVSYVEKLCYDMLQVVLCKCAVCADHPKSFCTQDIKVLLEQIVSLLSLHTGCYDVRCGALSDLCPERIRLLFYVGPYTGTFNQVTGVC